MGISPARRRVVGFGIGCTIGRTPATKTLCVISPYAAMEADALPITAPKFMLVPFICALPGNWLALLGCYVKQPHSIWELTVLMAEQNEIAIMRIDMYVIDPELFFAKYFFRLSCHYI